MDNEKTVYMSTPAKELADHLKPYIKKMIEEYIAKNSYEAVAERKKEEEIKRQKEEILTRTQVKDILGLKSADNVTSRIKKGLKVGNIYIRLKTMNKYGNYKISRFHLNEFISAVDKARNAKKNNAL